MTEQDTKEHPAAGSDEHHLQLRQLTIEDFDDIYEITKQIYPTLGPYDREDMEFLMNVFPDGQIGIEDQGKIVAAAFAVIVDYKKLGDKHTYEQVTANYTFKTHAPHGDTLYGIEMFVREDYRGMRLGRRLHDARKEICQSLNLRAIIFGGRMAGYKKYKDELSPQQYLRKVRAREISDPVISFQLSNGFHSRRILKNYLPGDEESGNYAVLMEWLNIYYEEDEEHEELFGKRKETVRVGAVQWQMRPVTDMSEIIEQVEYFVDAVSDYESDVVLFPEFFNGPMMARYNDLSPPESIRKMAEHTEPIRTAMSQMAVTYNINIIAGSMPEYIDGKLRNVSFLCRRDGSTDKQYKIHVTPDEVDYWGMSGGDAIRIFETDFGRVGILVCYDVQFPELSRILAEEGMQILFVPFWTDTKNGYQRVRHCAQARAIENECYVVLAGSTGNLPKVVNMDIQYAQAAILTPSDFAFPHDCIAAEATPNTEMTLIADLDMYKLIELHSEGSVRNLKDRRHDLYAIRKNPGRRKVGGE